MRGGYTILDFKGVNLEVGQQGKVIPGIYAQLEGNYYKPTLIENLVVDGIERCSRYVIFGVKNTSYIGNIGINSDIDLLTCTITSDDVVTLREQ